MLQASTIQSTQYAIAAVSHCSAASLLLMTPSRCQGHNAFRFWAHRPASHVHAFVPAQPGKGLVHCRRNLLTVAHCRSLRSHAQWVLVLALDTSPAKVTF